MWRFWKQGIALVALAAAVGLWCLPASLAKGAGGGGGGGGGTTYTYSLTDLLGFPSNGYQSRPYFITNRDQPAENYTGGNVLIYGVSRTHVEGMPEFHPALWRVDNTGAFPASDPLDHGLPGSAREVGTAGLNSLGIGVVNTTWSGEQDEAGNYIFPSYVDATGQPYYELRDVNGDRNTDVSGINDAGQIIGSSNAGGLLWQLNPDGTADPPTTLGFFTPCDTNNFGVMAGIYDGYMAIGWFEGGSLKIKKLVTPRSLGATPAAINDCAIDDPQLTVVGTSWRNEANQVQKPDSIRGLIWRPNKLVGTTTVIGTLGGTTSTALDVNLSGDVVGWSDTKRNGQHAFVCSGGVLSDLNAKVALGSQTLNWATGINDDGDIIGFMQYPRPISEQRGFLLRINNP